MRRDKVADREVFEQIHVLNVRKKGETICEYYSMHTQAEKRNRTKAEMSVEEDMKPVGMKWIVIVSALLECVSHPREIPK